MSRKIQLVIEPLEERIAPGVIDTKNNNGFGNGPESGPAPGNSGDSPNKGDQFNANFTAPGQSNGTTGPR